MTFKYTYRDAAGVQKSDWVDAETRQECFTALAERGIRPISVTEGKRPASQGVGRSRGLRYGILAGIVAVVVAVATWLLTVHKGQQNEPPAQKPATLAPRDAPRVAKSNPKTIEKPSAPQGDAPPQPSKKPTGKLPAPSNLSEEVRAIKAASLTNAVAAVTNARPEQVFKTATEQVMSFIFNAEVGAMPPPLPTLPRNEMERIEEILNTPNLVKEGDSEEVAAQKQMLERAKQELKDYMAQGGTPAEFLRFYHEQLKKYYQERQDAQTLVMTMIRDEPEVAGEFMKKVNQRLAERGIKAVHIPKPFLERAGIKAE